jgi:hypothetical protein
LEEVFHPRTLASARVCGGSGGPSFGELPMFTPGGVAPVSWVSLGRQMCSGDRRSPSLGRLLNSLGGRSLGLGRRMIG